MAHDQDFKIRVLPRKNESKADAKGAADKARATAPNGKKQTRWIIYVGTASLVVLLSAFTVVNPWSSPAPSGAKAKLEKTQQTDLSSVQDPVSAKVSRHMQDLSLKQEIRRQQQRLDNLKFKDPSLAEDVAIFDDQDRSLGVQLDQEDTVDKVYRDLNYRRSPNTGNLPDDRISARLANRKWMNEHQREERINFVRNFIRSAYDRGYQVEIDKNLVVVGVKKITEPRRVNIEQVIERMAKEGR